MGQIVPSLSYGHGPKQRDCDLVMAGTPFLQEPPGNYQGVPVFSRSQLYVQLLKLGDNKLLRGYDSRFLRK